MWHDTTRIGRSQWYPSIALLIPAVGLLAAGFCGGCQSQQATYAEPTQQPVGWSQLADGAAVSARDETRLNVAGETRGLFPTSIAVARVAASDNLEASQSPLVLAPHPGVDYLTWNSLFDDVRDVGEVFPLDPKALNGQPATPESLRNAALSLHAGLLLLYTEIRNGPGEAEMRGVLFDSRTGTVLAACHQSAVVEDPVSADEREDEDEPPALRESRDPRLVSLRGFEKNVRSAVLVLRNNDEPADTMAPEGWIPDRVMEPLIWPPEFERYLPPRP